MAVYHSKKRNKFRRRAVWLAYIKISIRFLRWDALCTAFVTISSAIALGAIASKIYNANLPGPQCEKPNFCLGDPGGDSLILISEAVPVCSEGGCLRLRELMSLIAKNSSLWAEMRRMVVLRDPSSSQRDFDYVRSYGWNLLPKWAMRSTFRTKSGSGYMPLSPESLFSPSRLSRKSAVLLTMWSYKLSLSGDPHPTVAEAFIPVIRDRNRNVCIIVISDDLQFERFGLEKNLTSDSQRRLKEREMKVYASADIVWFVTEEDKVAVSKELLEVRGRPVLDVMPYIGRDLNLLAREKRKLNPMTKDGIVYIGGPSYSNRKAVLWLVTEVMPYLSALSPEAKLTLVGSQWLKHSYAYNASNVRAVGFVENLDEVVGNARVLVLPSLVPSGLTTKLFIGFRYSIPIVTTPQGVRGLWQRKWFLSCLNTAISVESHPIAFATAIFKFIRNDFVSTGRWESATRCLRKTLDDDLAAELQKAAVRRAEETCLARRSLHLRPMETGFHLKEEKSHEHLTHYFKWENYRFILRQTDLTIFCTVFTNDLKLAREWFHDVVRQTALRIYVAELVLAVIDDRTCDHLRKMVSSRFYQLRAFASIKLACFQNDPGIYGAWDYIVNRLSSAPVLTNWNICDRKSPESLRLRLNVLAMHHEVDVVTTQVYVYSAQQTGMSWFKRSELEDISFDFGESRILNLSDMMVFKMIGEEHIVVGANNVPYNSPMWRKRLHDIAGSFNATSNIGCWDYSLWLRALSLGRIIYHLNLPLEMSMRRNDDLGLTTHSYADTDSSNVAWSNQCDSLRTWQLHVENALLQMKWRG